MSSQGGCIKNASHAPELVEAARDAEARAHTEIALEDLGIVGRRLRTARRAQPFVEAEHLAELAFRADEAAHIGLAGSSASPASPAEMPSSSAFTRAKSTHLTMLNQATSSARTTGPRGSFEIDIGQDPRPRRLGEQLRVRA